VAETYVVLPLTTDAAAELAALGIPHPAPPADPRPPMPRQVIAALGRLPGLEATVRRRPEKQLIRIDVNPPGTGNTRPAGSGTEISLFDVVGEDAACTVTFRGGTSALVAGVVDRIAAESGPLVVWPASGADPTVCWGRA
jgi:hypothetical protein